MSTAAPINSTAARIHDTLIQISSLFRNHNYRDAFRAAADALALEGAGIVAKVNHGVLVHTTLSAIKSFATLQIQNPFQHSFAYDFIDLYSCLESARKAVQGFEDLKPAFSSTLSALVEIPRLNKHELAMLLEIQKSFASASGDRDSCQNLQAQQFRLFAVSDFPEAIGDKNRQVECTAKLLKQIENLVGSKVPSGVCSYVLSISEQLIQGLQWPVAIAVLSKINLYSASIGDRIKIQAQLIYAEARSTGTVHPRDFSRLLISVNEAEYQDFDQQTCEILTRMIVAIKNPDYRERKTQIARKLKFLVDAGMSCSSKNKIVLDLCIARSRLEEKKFEILLVHLQKIDPALLESEEAVNLEVAEISAIAYQELFFQTGERGYYQLALKALHKCFMLADGKDALAQQRAIDRFRTLSSQNEPKSQVKISRPSKFS